MKISILTPTYNRARLLDKLYTSILINNNNSSYEIEWLIMDDGSTDCTKLVVENYIKEQIIDIKYFYQDNRGKMAAINTLTEKATGDLIIECDDDDYFSIDAFKIIEESLKECRDIASVYAMVFLKYDQDGNNMGNDFPDDNYESSMFDLYFKEGITGEKALVYNAIIRRQFKYELENNEKFVTEARLHHKMDMQYNVKCFNKKIMTCEYREDGYTNSIDKLFIENPLGYYEYFKEIFYQDMHGTTWNKRLYVYKHYVLFSVLTNKEHVIRNVNGGFNKLMVALLYVPGKIKTKKRFKSN